MRFNENVLFLQFTREPLIYIQIFKTFWQNDRLSKCFLQILMKSFTVLENVYNLHKSWRKILDLFKREQKVFIYSSTTEQMQRFLQSFVLSPQ